MYCRGKQNYPELWQSTHGEVRIYISELRYWALERDNETWTLIKSSKRKDDRAQVIIAQQFFVWSLITELK